ncbi:MAG: nuclease, partial [Candidatus Nanopelagicales bacterium]|nr:nuclease [Candidatus Nanopelagicales bacterium]
MTWEKFRPAVGLATALAGALLVACGGDADFVPIEAQPEPGLPMPSAVEGPFPVTRVVDGDTVRVLMKGQDTAVRLIGI